MLRNRNDKAELMKGYKDFRDYWQSLPAEQKRLLSQACGYATNTYLSNLAHGRDMPGVHTLAKLKKANKHLTPEFMRPDIWGKK